MSLTIVADARVACVCVGRGVARAGSLRERLMKTEGKNLVATNGWGEGYWGVSGGSGANELGKALMAVRARLCRRLCLCRPCRLCLQIACACCACALRVL